MRVRKASMVFSVVIIVLLLLIGFIVNNILKKGTKEVKVAKDFIEELYDSGIIENSYSIKKSVIKEETLNKLSNKDSIIKYSVIVGKYGVDIDKNFNILGFSNKNIDEHMVKSNLISEEDAIYLAKSYLSKITKDEFEFKEVKKGDNIESSFYNIIFYKYRNGYPYYKQEIKTVINKFTGKLEGYTNYPIENIKYSEEINIDEEEAIKILKDNFEGLKLEVTAMEDPILAYINISDKEMVLAYILNSNLKDKDGKEETCTSSVRADTGEVVNYNLESVAKK
ncbi:hypothetical protein ACQPVP_08060 [Clostridium nigeriense]|uniref:hypothetical protein n=1 Tax=Clostridium nigeriense TaxID=1805470 RepID=UPI003D337367